MKDNKSLEQTKRIDVDYAEVEGQQFLLVVDRHSKWIEVFLARKITVNAVIEVLKALFSRYGLQLELVSDNGPQLVAGEFQTFLKMNCIKHTLCPPYHPSTNRLADRHDELSKRCTELVLTKGHFSTRWLMSTTETHHTLQPTKPCSTVFKKSA